MISKKEEKKGSEKRSVKPNQEVIQKNKYAGEEKSSSTNKKEGTKMNKDSSC